MIVHRARTIEDLSHVSLLRLVSLRDPFSFSFLLSRSISLFNSHDRAIPGFIGKVHLSPTPPSSRLLCEMRAESLFPSLHLCPSFFCTYSFFWKKKFREKFRANFPAWKKPLFKHLTWYLILRIRVNKQENRYWPNIHHYYSTSTASPYFLNIWRMKGVFDF